MTLPVIIVGTGFGCRIQIPAFNASGFEVVGVVGTDPQRTAERASANGVTKAYTDVGLALDETGAKVVAVSTPPHTHSDITIQVLERGCHVLCEKPFARDLQDARRMLEVAKRNSTVCLIGNEFRFLPQRATIARAIADGMIGEPRFASIVQYSGYVANFENDIPGWWFDASQGGGWLGASGSHVVDQIRTWLGEFASVSATLSTVTASRGTIDDSFSVRFTLQNGLEGVMQQSSGAYGSFADMTRIAGSEGTLWTDGATIRHADRNGEREIPVPADLQLPEPPELTGDPRHDRLEWQVMASAEIAPYTQLCRIMHAEITGEPSPSPVRPANFADGVANMAVLDAVRKSAANSGAVVEIS